MSFSYAYEVSMPHWDNMPRLCTYNAYLAWHAAIYIHTAKFSSGWLY